MNPTGRVCPRLERVSKLMMRTDPIRIEMSIVVVVVVWCGLKQLVVFPKPIVCHCVINCVLCVLGLGSVRLKLGGN